jgi:allatostatin receptor
MANPQMKNTTNMLILNLAVADLLFILVCVPFTASDYVLMYWPFGLIWCRTVQYIIYVTAYVSIYTLVMMAGDRFLAVVCPVSSITIRTISNANIAICITWVVTLLSCSPVWMAHNLHDNGNGLSLTAVVC